MAGGTFDDQAVSAVPSWRSRVVSVHHEADQQEDLGGVMRSRICKKTGSPFQTARGGLTLIEMIVVIGIIAVLIAITIPAVMKVRFKALEMGDTNNLRQLVLTVRQHEGTTGRLPGRFRGGCGADDGWSFSVLHTLNDPVARTFQVGQPVENEANLRVGEQFRPSIFEAMTLSEVPIDVQALDDSAVYVKVRPTCFAFNGFLFHKKLANLQTSNTAMFAQVKQAGPWLLSPEFYAIEPPTADKSVLIGFADGSVDRRTSLEGVIIEP